MSIQLSRRTLENSQNFAICVHAEVSSNGNTIFHASKTPENTFSATDYPHGVPVEELILDGVNNFAAPSGIEL